MNSKQHALNSSIIFGGKPEDYQMIHELIDSNKTNSFSIYGRFFLHHIDIGGEILESIFSRSWKRLSDQKSFKVKEVLIQHLIEDYDRVPVIADWLNAFGVLGSHASMPTAVSGDELREKIAEDEMLRKIPEKYSRLMEDLFELKAFKNNLAWRHPSRYCVFGHALGIHLADQILPEMIAGMWTLDLLVRYADAKFKGVPTLMEYEQYLNKEEWMLAPKNYDRQDPEVTRMKIKKFLLDQEAFAVKKHNIKITTLDTHDFHRGPGRCGGRGVLD